MGIEEEIGVLLRKNGLTLAVAESCSGGMLGQRITAVSGSSDYFIGGVIAYSNEVKIGILHVERTVLEEHGAVSSESAARMALGVKDALGADLGLSITGIAGPGGCTAEKPVGLVFVGYCDECGSRAERFIFEGARENIRRCAVDEALTFLRNTLLERK